MDYAVSTTNGDGQTNAASTNRNAIAARVQFSPLGKMANDEPDLARTQCPLLTVGANYFYTSLGAGESSSTYGTTFNPPATPAGVKNELQNYGVDAHFKWMGLALQGEGLFTQSNPNAGRKTVNTVGYYGQAGYMITPKIGVALRYSQFDPNRDVSNDLQTEQIGCVSYYFDKHNLKLQADVANLHTQVTTGGSRDDMQYRVQAQLVF
jgi:phosphate-selective porin OprO/OprP